MSPINIEEVATLETLRARLEQLNVFKRLGTFQFWDAKEDYRIDIDFESLNSIQDCVHLIPARNNNNRCCKRPRVGAIVCGEEFVWIVEEVLTLDTDPPVPLSNEVVQADPTSSSRVSGSEEPSVMEGPPMKSTLVPIDVLEWYSKAEEKLHKDLKQVFMQDHD